MEIAKLKPIIFSTDMVKAILEDRKTQTRRVVKDKMLQDEKHDIDFLKLTTSSKYKVGDILWVRETWQKRSDSAIKMGFEKYYYKANWTMDVEAGWKPSIHMPKEASRIYLEVVSIRIEKLLDISTDDAISEGVLRYPSSTKWLNYISKKDALTQFIYNLNNPIDSFFSLWDAINGRNTHLENPYVWVIKFKNITSKFIKDYDR